MAILKQAILIYRGLIY